MALYALICRATGVRSAAQSHSTDAGLAQMAGNHSDTEQKGLVPKIRGGWRLALRGIGGVAAVCPGRC